MKAPELCGKLGVWKQGWVIGQGQSWEMKGVGNGQVLEKEWGYRLLQSMQWALDIADQSEAGLRKVPSPCIEQTSASQIPLPWQVGCVLKQSQSCSGPGLI